MKSSNQTTTGICTVGRSLTRVAASAAPADVLAAAGLEGPEGAAQAPTRTATATAQHAPEARCTGRRAARGGLDPDIEPRVTQTRATINRKPEPPQPGARPGTLAIEANRKSEGRAEAATADVDLACPGLESEPGQAVE